MDFLDIFAANEDIKADNKDKSEENLFAIRILLTIIVIIIFLFLFGIIQINILFGV
ncbi:hypothetical protein HON03_00580 [archaeon]|jgi:hypothetical protein|nr:hypothetical protein [archaeon]MBT5287512.1 hypothetical protein [archaeon]